jgi:hypothetical protein
MQSSLPEGARPAGSLPLFSKLSFNTIVLTPVSIPGHAPSAWQSSRDTVAGPRWQGAITGPARGLGGSAITFRRRRRGLGVAACTGLSKRACRHLAGALELDFKAGRGQARGPGLLAGRWGAH